MSEEQLVRMGRNDLYRRRDTEIKDGRIVAKPREDAVTVLTTTLTNTEFCCLYQRGGGAYQVKPNGRYGVGAQVHSLDLVAIDPAPKLVPWEWEEIPWEHWFRVKHGFVCKRIAATDNTTSRVYFDEYAWVSLQELLAQHEHSTTPQGPFEPCGKVV